MALEFFAQVNGEGDIGVPRSNDYLFVGTQGDFRTLARWIHDGFEAGARKPTLKALANRIEAAVPTAHHLRFKAKECRLIIEALERKKNSDKKSPAASALLKKLSNCLCVYD